MNLITGATGFVGSYLCKYLLLKNETVFALKRKNSNTNLLQDVKEKINWIDCDLNDIYTLNNVAKSVKNIYHCAAKVSYLPKLKNEMYQTNVNGTTNLLNVAIENNINKFLHLSSISVLGKNKNEFKNESNEWNEETTFSQYAKSKYLAEKEVWRASAEGLNVVILNPSIIFGTGDFKKSSLQIFNMVYNGLKYYTNGCTGYVDVRDVCKIAFKLMNSKVKNERFIVSENNYNYKFIFDEIAKNLNVKAPYKIPTKRQAKFAYLFEKAKSKLLNTKPLITKETVDMAFNKNKFSNKKVKDVLNYNFIPIQKTIEESCKLFLQTKQNNHIYTLPF